MASRRILPNEVFYNEYICVVQIAIKVELNFLIFVDYRSFDWNDNIWIRSFYYGSDVNMI